MGTVITKGNARDLTFAGLGTILNAGVAQLEIGLVGRSENTHLVSISAGPLSGTQRALSQANFSGFENPQLTLDLQMSDFNSNGSLVVKVLPQGPQSVDNVSVAYAKITFRKPVQPGDFEPRLMIFPEGNQRAVISQVQENYVAVDVSDRFNAQKVGSPKQEQL